MSCARKQLMVAAVIALATSVLIAPRQAKGDDTYVKIQEMVNDLGGPANQKANNGKVLKCVNGGTKKITIKGGSYQGVYKNCREYGRTRDGQVFISIGGGGGQETQNDKRSSFAIAADAAYNGDIKTLSAIIKKNKKLVNATETIPHKDGGEVSGWTMLMSAAKNNNIGVARLLVVSGANVNVLNSDGLSAIWIAAAVGNTEIVKYLLSVGVKKDVQAPYGTSPLMAAAGGGHLDTVNVLIKAKANLDLKHKDGDTALFFAIAEKHALVALTLIDAGAELNLVNKFDATPLTLAVDRKNIQATRRLLEMGAKAGFEKAVKIANIIGDQDIKDLLNSYK